VSTSRPSIDDVGRRAGVSRQTVSRVLNGHPAVSEGARQRVETAIAELRYRPSAAARALVTGRADVIGVVTSRLTSFGTAATLAAFEEAAAAAGLGIQVTTVAVPDGAAVRAAVTRLLDRGVTGLALQVPAPELDPGVPIVGLGVAVGPHSAVLADQVVGARLATEALLAAGHRTVWHVAGPQDSPDGAARAEGWRLALGAAGAPVPPAVPAADWGSTAGYASGCELGDDVTAVFAAGDCLALGVLRALHEHGVDVPGQVALIGFDDIPDAANFRPPLTTVRLDFAAVGRRALELLLPQLRAGAAPGERVTIQPRLVVRASAATPSRTVPTRPPPEPAPL
jgi:DNA-binding LacI/PurR family transcriptional regulator